MDIQYDMILGEIVQRLNGIKPQIKTGGNLIDIVLNYIRDVRAEQSDDIIILRIAKTNIDEEIMIEFGDGQYSQSMPRGMASCIADQLAILYANEGDDDIRQTIQSVIDDLSFN